MDLISLIHAYENGETDLQQEIFLYAELVRTGKAWTLQGHYGRTANHLINEGYLLENGDLNNERLLDIGIL